MSKAMKSGTSGASTQRVGGGAGREGGGAASRRARYLATTSVLLLAVSAVCVFGVMLASRHPVRWDMTATREHQLSERTQKVLANLKGPHEIMVVANASTVDPRALERTQSVLGAIARSSEQVSASFIDAGSARGHAQLDEVLTRLTTRYQDGLTKASKGVADANAAARALAGDIELLAGQMQGVQDAIADAGGDPNITAVKRFFADSASVLRVSSHELTQACVNSEKLLGSPIPGTVIVPTARAASALRLPGASVLRQLEPIQQTTAAVAGVAGATAVRGVPKDLQQKAVPISQSLSRVRDQAARLLLDLDQVARTPLESVVHVVSSSSAVLVIGPPPSNDASAGAGGSASGSAGGAVGSAAGGGLTAVDLTTLLPPRVRELEGAVQPDLRFRAEELLTGALASLSMPNAPIVCITHGAPSSTRLNADSPLIEALVTRLRLRGIDVIEWPAADVDEPIGRNAVDPEGRRPVVYAVVPINAMAGAEGATRSAKLNKAVAGLVESRQSVLLSLNPSNLPAMGQPDPAVDFLASYGIKPATGHPLLRRQPTQTGGFVTPDLFILRTEQGHPVAEAAQSLRTYLAWALPIGIDASAGRSSGTEVWPLMVVPDDGTVWGEADWLGFRQTPADQRASLVNPPTPESVRDDKNGPWTVAVAGEHCGVRDPTSKLTARCGRLIVVGSNRWFFDEFTQVGELIDAQMVARNPGNLEFFEAAVYWLSGQDNLIARSADAQAAALIPDLSDGTQITLRWVLIAGLPVIVLLIGVLYRVARG